MIKKEYDEQKRLKEEKIREKEEFEEEVKRIAEKTTKEEGSEGPEEESVSGSGGKEDDSGVSLASPDAPEEKHVPKNANQMWTDQKRPDSPWPS